MMRFDAWAIPIAAGLTVLCTTVAFADDGNDQISVTGRSLPTPDQLVGSVEEGRQRYRSFTANLKITHHPIKDGQLIDPPSRTEKVIWRWTKDRSYIDLDVVDQLTPGSTPQHTKKLYAITPQRSKELLVFPRKGRPRGSVKKGPYPAEDLPLTPVHALWGLLGYDWSSMLRDAKVRLDPTANRYVLEGDPADTGDRLRIAIDPTKGFLPVDMTYFRGDGKPSVRVRFNDLRQSPDGLWIPFEYRLVRFDQQGEPDFVILHTVLDAEVNMDIPDKQLDFSFPMFSNRPVNDIFPFCGPLWTLLSHEQTTIDTAAVA